MTGFIKFNWHAAKITSVVEVAGRHGVESAAHALLKRANEHVPFQFGTLKESGTVSVDGTTAAVSYGAVYAAKLHQHPEYNFRGQGRGRWLQDAAEQQEGYLTNFAVPMRDSFGKFMVRP
jgi:hypothetical protein